MVSVSANALQSQQKRPAKQISANESSHQLRQKRPAKHTQSAAAVESSHQSAGQSRPPKQIHSTDGSSNYSRQKRPTKTLQVSPGIMQEKHFMPTLEENETTSIHKSPSSSRKRSGVDLQSKGERVKRRRILEAVESVPPSSSTSKSPDVAVSSLE